MTDIPQMSEMSRVSQIDCPNVNPIRIQQIALINIESIVRLALPILSERRPPIPQAVPPAIPIELKKRTMQ